MKPLTSLDVPGSRRTTAPCSITSTRSLAKERVEVIEQGAVVRRLPGTSKLVSGFIKIDRMGGSFDQLFAGSCGNMIPRRKVGTERVQQQHAPRLGRCGIQCGEQQYARQQGATELR